MTHLRLSSQSLARGVATITSVVVPPTAPVKPVVVFTVKDAAGNAVAGLSSFNFTVAQLVPAATGGVFNWRSLINRNYGTATDVSIGGTTEVSVNARTSSTSASQLSGTLVESPAGTYTYTFGNDLSVVTAIVGATTYGVVSNAFDAGLPTRIGLQSGAPVPGSLPSLGGPTSSVVIQPTPPFNATFDLHVYGPTVTAADPDPRGLVTTAACNACHQRLTAHGRRLDVDYCVTCHTPYSLDPSLPAADRAAGGTVDFKRVIHKLHMGKNLPSVLAGGSFLFHGVDFSAVGFPMMTSNSTSDTGNCTACHAATTVANGPAANNWKLTPTMVACGSCHDLISFVDPAPAGMTLHAGGAMSDDGDCAACHAAGRSAAIDVVHTGLAALQAAATGRYRLGIVSVANTAPGQFPVVTFSVVDPTNANVPYTLAEAAWTQTASGASRLAIDLAWSTRATASAGDTNYTNEGSGADPGQPITIDALASKVAGTAAGTFTVTSTVAVPAAAVGVGEAVLEGHRPTRR